VGVGTTHRGSRVGVTHRINSVGGFHKRAGHNRP
jgi:hypothetical protein